MKIVLILIAHVFNSKIDLPSMLLDHNCCFLINPKIKSIIFSEFIFFNSSTYLPNLKKSISNMIKDKYQLYTQYCRGLL